MTTHGKTISALTVGWLESGEQTELDARLFYILLHSVARFHISATVRALEMKMQPTTRPYYGPGSRFYSRTL